MAVKAALLSLWVTLSVPSFVFQARVADFAVNGRLAHQLSETSNNFLSCKEFKVSPGIEAALKFYFRLIAD